MPQFVVIDQIMQLCENTVILKVLSLLTLGRDQHFSSYIVCKPFEPIEREVNIALVTCPLVSIVRNDAWLFCDIHLR